MNPFRFASTAFTYSRKNDLRIRLKPLSGPVAAMCVAAAMAAAPAPVVASITDTWTGAVSSNFGDLNWSTTNLSQLPVSGDTLAFGSAGTAGTSLVDNLFTNSSFSIAGITFNAGASAFTINPGGASNGFTLSGAITNNSTSLETINDAITLASGVQTITTTAGGGNVTLGGVLSGTDTTSAPTLSGGGTVTLSAANTYAGVTTVSAGGTVNVSGDESAATGGWNLSTPTGTAITVDFQATSKVVVASGSTFQLTGSSSAGSAQPLATLDVEGIVTNNGTLKVGRHGDLEINSGATWTQSGGMNVTAVTGSGATMAVNGGTFTYSGGALIALNSGSTTGVASLKVAGGTFVTGQGFTNNTSGGTGSGNLVLSNGGTLQLTSNTIGNLVASSSVGTINVSLGNGGGVIDTNGNSVTITQNLGNATGQTGSLTKMGAGTLTLSGTNCTYTGTTTVNGGTLVVSGSLNGTAGVSVASGATVSSGASGSITTAAAGNISVSGTLAPGDVGSVGTLTLAPGSGGQLSFASGSTLAIDVSGTNSDRVAFSTSGNWLLGSGNVTLSLSGLTPASYANTYILFSNVTTSGFSFASITGYDAAAYVPNFAQVGTNYQLSFTPTPEPGAFTSLVAGLGMLCIFRRRRKAVL